MPTPHFKKGNPGRPLGAKNKLTTTVREKVLEVFNDLQSDDKANLLSFAKKYPRDFYSIAARLIPIELQAKVTKINLEIVRTSDSHKVTQTSSIANEGDNGIQEIQYPEMRETLG